MSAPGHTPGAHHAGRGDAGTSPHLSRRHPDTRDDPRLRRRVRWFVGAHVTAIALVYALALHLGGGYAMPPVPTEGRGHLGHATNPLAAQASTDRTASREANTDALEPSRGPATVLHPARRHTVDLAPAWVFDTDRKTSDDD